LIPANSPNEVTLEIEGHRLKLTNLNKVFYPGEGITKRDVINYYDAVAPLILPHLRDRPLSLKRYPNGINEQFFFQKDAEGKVPDWVRLEPIFSEHNQDKIHYIICNDRATLVYLANLASIDQNPWMSRIGTLDNPDFALIDLDPTEGCPYSQIVEAAQLVKNTLDSIGLAGYPKTTGGDGMHIYIPLEPVYTFEQVRSFAELLSVLVVNQNPDLFTTPRTVSRRKKAKVYFDYLQISSGKTIAAPYVLRAHPGAPVSTPLDWSEVKAGLEPGQFNIHNALDRFERTGDLFEAVLRKPQRLEPALERVGGNSASPERNAEKNDQHRDHFLQSDVLAEKQPAQENRDHRIDVVVDTDHGNGQPFQRDDVSAVADNGTEHHQVSDCADAAAAPSGRMRFREQRRHCKRETGGKLLHRSGDDRMRRGLMTPLENGTEAPAEAAQLQQHKSAQQRAPEAFAHDLGSNQERGSGQAHQHGEEGGTVQTLAAGDQRIDADHPEWR
jgi:DNA ligase D-like protein (predicted polymerase)